MYAMQYCKPARRFVVGCKLQTPAPWSNINQPASRVGALLTLVCMRVL